MKKRDNPFPLATIEAEWETFFASCNLDDALAGASEIQRAEMKRAFYGGALVCLNHALAGRALQAIAAELAAFCDLIAEDKA